MMNNETLQRIGDKFDVLIGGTPSRRAAEYWDREKTSDNVWLSIRDITQLNGRYIFDSAEYITDIGAKRSNVKLIPKNTALMTFKLTVGRTVVTGKDLFTNEAIAAFVPKKGTECDPYYLALVLPYLDYNMDQAIKGKTLNKPKIENALIPLPDIKIQKTYAEIIGSVDDTIELDRQILKQRERLKHGLMQDLLTGKARV